MVERDTVARDERWNELVIQLRSQLALKEATGELEQAFLDEPLRNELTMTAKTGHLSVWLHPETGEGSWNVISERDDRAEPWFLSPEGVMQLSGANTDIAGAVAIFIKKISPK